MRSVIWAIGVVLTGGGEGYGKDGSHDDAVLATFSPYRQGPAQTQGVQAGMQVGQHNVAAVAAALPAELLALVQKGELSFTVQDSTDLPPPEDYIEATRMHSRSVTLGEGKLDGYVAGLPFPSIEAHDPRAGEKVMWNFRYRDRGNTKEYWGGIRSLTTSGAVDRTFNFHGMFLYGMHRPDSKTNVLQWEHEGMYYKQFLEFTAPPDMNGNMTLTTRYDDDMTPDSQSAYDIQVRRIRHPPVNHLAAALGLYMLVEDQWGFSGYLHPYHWRFLGKQVVLAPGVAKADHLTLGGRGGWYPTAPWELRQVYVVEATPTGSHPYGRRVFYIDQQTANVLFILVFTPEGQHWRTIFRVYAHPDFTPWNKNQRIWVTLGHCWIDHMAQRAAVYVADKTIYNQPIEPGRFEPGELRQRGK